MPILSSPRPVAKANYIEEELTVLLRNGYWRVGDPLPPEAELAEHYGVCKLTLKKAIRALAKRGLVVSRRGSRHFVGARESRAKTWTIGFMVHHKRHVAHPGIMARFAGLQAGLIGTPYQIKTLVHYDKPEAVADGSPLPPKPHELPFDPSTLDALVTHVHGFSLDALRNLSREMPLCTEDWFECGRRVSRLNHDYTSAAMTVLGQFLWRGHRRILFAHSDWAYSWTVDLHNAVALAHQAHPGVAFEVEHWMLGTEDLPEAGAALARRLLATPADRRPTAVYTSFEALAGLLPEWGAAGLSIPGDLSVATLGGPVVDPALARASYVRLDRYRLGEETARELLRLLDDPDAEGRRIVLTPEWTEGETLSPPPRL